MRIDKYLCDTLNMTRSQARKIITSGRVFADGSVVTSASVCVTEHSNVTLDGTLLRYSSKYYIMMNKPAGVVSAAADKRFPVALDLLDAQDRRRDYFIAGRLDKDTTGFLLITNDGEFSHEILSPKKHVLKTYEVELETECPESYAEQFRAGVVLEDGYHCQPAFFVKTGGTRCMLQIAEGKYHQVKRMFESLGNTVTSLKRIAIGGLPLDATLQPGKYRHLTSEEVKMILCNPTKSGGQ